MDHLGLALDEEEFFAAISEAQRRELRIQEHGGRRTFVATGVGYRLELHPPRDWIEELLSEAGDLRLAELHLLADDPESKAAALAGLLDLEYEKGSVEVGETIIRFLPGGPQGRPELHGELFL